MTFIPVDMWAQVLRCLSMDVLAKVVTHHRKYLEENNILIEHLFLSEAMRRGDHRAFYKYATVFSPNVLSLTDAYRGQSEAILKYFAAADVDWEERLRSAIQGRNKDAVSLLLYNKPVDNALCSILWLDAIRAKSVECLRILPPCSSLHDHIYSALKSGQIDIVSYFFNDCGFRFTCVDSSILTYFQVHDNALLLDLVVQTMKTRLSFSWLKRSVHDGLVNCTKYLFNKCCCTRRQNILLLEECQHARMIPVLWDLFKDCYYPFKMWMDPDDISILLTWIFANKEDCFEKALCFHYLFIHSNGSVEFCRLRYEVGPTRFYCGLCTK
jgi:hypothetical protein